MKKFIQISLIVILTLVLFQAAAGVGASSSSVGARNTFDVSSTAEESAQGVEMAACFIYIKGVICVTPNVGWNS